jgi:hypothetical protein
LYGPWRSFISEIQRSKWHLSPQNYSFLSSISKSYLIFTNRTYFVKLFSLKCFYHIIKQFKLLILIHSKTFWLPWIFEHWMLSLTPIYVQWRFPQQQSHICLISLLNTWEHSLCSQSCGYGIYWQQCQCVHSSNFMKILYVLQAVMSLSRMEQDSITVTKDSPAKLELFML